MQPAALHIPKMKTKEHLPWTPLLLLPGGLWETAACSRGTRPSRLTSGFTLLSIPAQASRFGLYKPWKSTSSLSKLAHSALQQRANGTQRPSSSGLIHDHHSPCHYEGHNSDPSGTQRSSLCDRGESFSTGPPKPPMPPTPKVNATGQNGASGIDSSEHPPNTTNVTPRLFSNITSTSIILTPSTRL